MKFLESFSDRNPDDKQVKMWEDYLDKNYTNFYDTEFGKMIMVDDKSYFLKDKGELTNRIFFDIKNVIEANLHEPSLRKAIKNWIDRLNIDKI